MTLNQICSICYQIARALGQVNTARRRLGTLVRREIRKVVHKEVAVVIWLVTPLVGVFGAMGLLEIRRWRKLRNGFLEDIKQIEIKRKQSEERIEHLEEDAKAFRAMRESLVDELPAIFAVNAQYTDARKGVAIMSLTGARVNQILAGSGGVVDVLIDITSGLQGSKICELTLKFDPSFLEYLSYTPSEHFPLKLPAHDTDGRLKIALGTFTNSAADSGLLYKIKFRVLKTGYGITPIELVKLVVAYNPTELWEVAVGEKTVFVNTG